MEQQEFLLENAKLKAERDAMARQKSELAEQSQKMEEEAAVSNRFVPAQTASIVHEDMAAGEEWHNPFFHPHWNRKCAWGGRRAGGSPESCTSCRIAKICSRPESVAGN